ncbi:MAG: hypothetical protein IID08_09440 [Candidatus Hydrogenedentes bacterium]|nr:hypothetical protein [Candidatus Hydrogenedentota bacterium]
MRFPVVEGATQVKRDRIWAALLLGAWAFAGTAVAVAEPMLEVVPESRTPRPSVTYRVEYRVSWPVGDAEYAVLAPELGALDWAEVEHAAVRTSVRDGVTTWTHTLLLNAFAPGDFVVPELAIGYIELESAPDAPEPGEAPAEVDAISYLNAGALSLHVRPDRRPVWAALLAAVVLAGLVVVWRTRAQKTGLQSQTANGAASEWETLQAGLHAARQHRLDGAYYEYFVGLREMVSLFTIDSETKALRDRLDAKAQETGFQGLRPTDDDLEGAFRDVERLLAHRGERI